MSPSPGSIWLARVRHDLVKRVLWPARDRRDLGGAPRPGELVPTLIDGEGRAIAWKDLWDALRAEAPDGLPAPALEAFAHALAHAWQAAEHGDVAGVLQFEEADAALARFVERGGARS